ncbi:hypothetical protein PpBr36_04707 [Pyricularia pennisetigena]|uniref:hypothetical protein n=1 Tax=Pyricularia pennisetigena TaxID=1578925 RepID=UPI0011520E19|nr:hypothetical protein PpBr36_04707 [Pyricularia pennisetigena]TLS26329.1 hypothetical protein PpBr36_04707 [Pyricularia pennisetigena]
MSDVKILDGGLGTTLEDRFGVVFTHTKPLWSSDLLVSDHETLQACQCEFAAAGADVLLTATYQVSVEAFAGTKTPEHPDGIAPSSAMLPYLRRAVDVAAKAAAAAAAADGTPAPPQQPAEIALACGPYGAAMTPGQEYTGAYDAEHSTSAALSRWHLDRLALYAAAGADVPSRCAYVAFETVPNLAEVWAVREAVTRLRQGASASSSCRFPSRFWISCVFPREDERLADGSSVEQVVEAMLTGRRGEDGGAREALALPWGIGINCTKIYKLEGLIRSFEKSISDLQSKGVVTDVPALVLYPDGTNGEVYNTTTKKWEVPQGVQGDGPKTPWDVQLTQIVNNTRERGVFTSFLVGGCCKANPQNIKDLRDRLKA